MFINKSNGNDIEIESKQVPVRDVIHRRSPEEVTMYTQSQPREFRGLIEPSDLQVPVQQGPNSSQHIGYFVLVDDHQVENLDEVVQVNEDTQVELVKVVQLSKK